MAPMHLGVAMLLLVALATSAASLPALSLPSLVPAFVWSNHRQLGDHLQSVSYGVVSSEDFAGKVKNEFVWPTFGLGQQEEEEEQEEEEFKRDVDLDVMLVFVGTKLQSRDISRGGEAQTANLLQVLNRVVTSSNSSVSVPYVAPSRDGASVANVLVGEILGDVEDGESRVGEVITTGACVNKNAPRTNRMSVNVLQDYLLYRMRTRAVGKTDLVVVCSSPEIEESSNVEGEILQGLVWGLDESRARYVALYTTDLSGEKAVPLRPRGRQLGSVVYEGEEYCNEVCQTKAVLLEGLFVGLTLLIILISGLCCMAGITTPSRFEQSKEGQ